MIVHAYAPAYQALAYLILHGCFLPDMIDIAAHVGCDFVSLRVIPG